MKTPLKRSVLVLLATTVTAAFAFFPMSSSGETTPSTRNFQITAPPTTPTTVITTTTVDPSLAAEAKKAAEVALWMKVHKANEAEKARVAANVAKWIAVTNWNKWMKEAARVEAARKAAARHSDPPYVQGIEVCNGRDLPPCYVVQRESRFNPNAKNPKSSAWGLYQMLKDTFRSVCPEYRHGSASVAQQVECGRRLWNNGRGASHWRATV